MFSQLLSSPPLILFPLSLLYSAPPLLFSKSPLRLFISLLSVTPLRLFTSLLSYSPLFCSSSFLFSSLLFLLFSSLRLFTLIQFTSLISSSSLRLYTSLFSSSLLSASPFLGYPSLPSSCLLFSILLLLFSEDDHLKKICRTEMNYQIQEIYTYVSFEKLDLL